MSRLRTYSKEEVAILLQKANYSGYVQGYSDKREEITRRGKERKDLSKHEAGRILQHAESFLK